MSGDFWPARSDLALPRWMPWAPALLYPGFKQLAEGTCSVELRLRLAAGGRLLLAAVQRDFKRQQRTVLSVSATGTQALSYADNSDVSSSVAVTETPGLLSAAAADGWSQLTFSWCGGALTLGTAAAPALVTVAAATGTSGARFLMASADGAGAELRLGSGAADPWLLQPAADPADQVFEIEPCSLLRPPVAATDDVSITYDCDADRDCGVYLSDGDPTRLLGVTVGGWGNTRCALQVYRTDTGSASYHEADTGPLLTAGTFVTLTVRYRAGEVTVQRSTDAAPVFQATAPPLLGDITSVAVGSMWHEGGRKRVRLARYDPAWASDTWRTQGTGFSNMAP